jgi:uncharacterized protein (DUF1015 family)
MAEIAPLKTMRFDPEVAGSFESLIAPPYDVIDEDLRARLAAGNEYNVVEIDLPAGEDKYNHSAELIDQWRESGALTVEDEPALWMLRQDYTGPDGAVRTRHGIFCRVRVEEYGPGRIRPHERTHPGPKQDRLDLMRATKANLSPIFSLFSDDDGRFQRLLQDVAGQEPFTSCPDLDGNRNTLWRVSDPAIIDAIELSVADRELLIADGHHRYETARIYAEEIGGEGDHNYVLMFLCALQDPGMTVFATNRLASNTTPEQQEAIRTVAKESFELTETTLEDLAPSGEGPAGEFGYYDSHLRKPYRLRLKDQSIADEALAGMPPAYRSLDTAILEALFLKGALGMSDDDISHLNGLGYSSDFDETVELVNSGEYDLAFFLRPTPVPQIRQVAAEGENMPPKSTYFYPKIPTGFVFNPLG